MQIQLTSLFSFPKRLRLLCSKDFRLVFQARRILRTRFFRVYWHSNEEGVARLGIVVPKRVCKLAKDRNQAKRIIRESFRRHRAQLGSLDIVIMLDRKPLHDQNQVLFEDLASLWVTLAESI